MDDLVSDFVIEAHNHLSAFELTLSHLEQNSGDASNLDAAFRHMHTIKGSSGFLAFKRIGLIAHHAENILARFRDQSLEITPARLSALYDVVDRLEFLLLAIVTTGSEPEGDDDDFVSYLNAIRDGKDVPSPDMNMTNASEQLGLIVSELKNNLDQAQMQPIGQVWSKFPRLVRDLSATLGKNIRLEMRGKDTMFDIETLNAMRAPLMHLVRNAADHGIELPDERKVAGKSEIGCITLSASIEGSHATITVSDDGRGLSRDDILSNLKDRDLVQGSELEHMPDQELFGFIFKPGFSTADSVTQTSGRGVGLDVVRTSIEQIGGTVDVESTATQGTVFTITIPTNQSL